VGRGKTTETIAISRRAAASREVAGIMKSGWPPLLKLLQPPGAARPVDAARGIGTRAGLAREGHGRTRR
jgi:hypothetical protein